MVRGSSDVWMVSRCVLQDQEVGAAHLNSVCACLCVIPRLPGQGEEQALVLSRSRRCSGILQVPSLGLPV